MVMFFIVLLQFKTNSFVIYLSFFIFGGGEVNEFEGINRKTQKMPCVQYRA